MAQNGPAPEDTRGQIVELARHRLDDLHHERERIKVELDLVDEEIRGMEKVLTSVGETVPGKKKSKPSGKKGVSEELIATVLEAARARESEQPFTVAEMAAKLDRTTSAVQVAIRTLRDRDLVLMTGRIPLEPGKRGLAPYGYVLAG